MFLNSRIIRGNLMDDNKYDGVKDVKWKQVNNGESKIKLYQ